MAETYGIFLITLMAVAVLGGFAAKFGVAPQALDKVGLLTRILTSITAAGLLSVAFVADTLAADTQGPADFFGDRTARDSLSMVLLMLAAGASGLLSALTLTLSSPVSANRHWFVVAVARILRRWCGRCLAVATVSVLLLFPAVVVVILSASDVGSAS